MRACLRKQGTGAGYPRGYNGRPTTTDKDLSQQWTQDKLDQHAHIRGQSSSSQDTLDDEGAEHTEELRRDPVAEDSSASESEKLQKRYDNHAENRNVKYRKVKPITILVTKNIAT